MPARSAARCGPWLTAPGPTCPRPSPAPPTARFMRRREASTIRRATRLAGRGLGVGGAQHVEQHRELRLPAATDRFAFASRAAVSPSSFVFCARGGVGARTARTAALQALEDGGSGPLGDVQLRAARGAARSPPRHAALGVHMRRAASHAAKRRGPSRARCRGQPPGQHARTRPPFSECREAHQQTAREGTFASRRRGGSGGRASRRREPQPETPRSARRRRNLRLGVALPQPLQRCSPGTPRRRDFTCKARAVCGTLPRFGSLRRRTARATWRRHAQLERCVGRTRPWAHSPLFLFLHSRFRLPALPALRGAPALPLLVSAPSLARLRPRLRPRGGRARTRATARRARRATVALRPARGVAPRATPSARCARAQAVAKVASDRDRRPRGSAPQPRDEQHRTRGPARRDAREFPPARGARGSPNVGLPTGAFASGDDDNTRSDAARRTPSTARTPTPAAATSPRDASAPPPRAPPRAAQICAMLCKRAAGNAAASAWDAPRREDVCEAAFVLGGRRRSETQADDARASSSACRRRRRALGPRRARAPPRPRRAARSGPCDETDASDPDARARARALLLDAPRVGGVLAHHRRRARTPFLGSRSRADVGALRRRFPPRAQRLDVVSEAREEARARHRRVALGDREAPRVFA